MAIFFLSSKKIQEIDYNKILNVGLIFFSTFLVLSLIIDIYFINSAVDPNIIWKNYRTYQLDKFVFQNLYWQGVSSSNFAIIPFIIFFIINNNKISIKEMILISLLVITSVFWHSMQLIFIISLVIVLIIFKNYKNLIPISFSIIISFLFLFLISTVVINNTEKQKTNFEINKKILNNYLTQFVNLKDILHNVFGGDDNYQEISNLQSHAIIEAKKDQDEFYFISIDEKLIIKNISLQDKLVPLILSLKKSRELKHILFGEGFRSYRETLPKLWRENLDYFKYNSKEDDKVSLLLLKSKTNSEFDKSLPFSKCEKIKNSNEYSCISFLNYSTYKSPTSLIAAVYDYGIIFILLIILLIIYNLIVSKKEFILPILTIYFFIFLFIFTCDLTDSILMYFILFFIPIFFNNEKTNIKYLS